MAPLQASPEAKTSLAPNRVPETRRKNTNAPSHTLFSEEQLAPREQTPAQKKKSKKSKKRSAPPAQAPQITVPSSAPAPPEQAPERKRKRDKSLVGSSDTSFTEASSPEPAKQASTRQKTKSPAPSPASQRRAQLASLLQTLGLAVLLEPMLDCLHTATEFALFSEDNPNMMQGIAVDRTFHSKHKAGTVYYWPDVVREGLDACFIGVRFGEWSKDEGTKDEGTWQWGDRARISIPKDGQQTLPWVKETLDKFRTLSSGYSLFPVCSSPSFSFAECGYRVKHYGKPGTETLDRYKRAIRTPRLVNLKKNWTGPDLGPAIEELLRFKWRAGGQEVNPIIVEG